MKICTKIVNMSNIPILSAPMSSPPHPSGRYSLRILLPEVRQTKASRGGALRSYRERLCVLTESVTAPLPRASQRSYRERPCVPIMIVLSLQLRGGKPAPPSQPPRGLHPTLSDNIHIRLGGTAYGSSSPRCDRQRPQEGVSTLLPRAPQRSYRERLCALTESVTALLPRASLRPYRERHSALTESAPALL